LSLPRTARNSLFTPSIPPGYRDWARLVLPMIDNTIAAARASGARIVLPGTVYNYGPNAFPVLRESVISGTAHA
jgi:hypothetical protein